MTANDAPILDEALITALREDLAGADWTLDALEELLSERARSALEREQRIPALVELEGRQDPASILTRLFVLGNVESEGDLGAALPRLGVRGARALGLVAEAGEGVDGHRHGGVLQAGRQAASGRI